jgi:hypothetical protein
LFLCLCIKRKYSNKCSKCIRKYLPFNVPKGKASWFLLLYFSQIVLLFFSVNVCMSENENYFVLLS